MVIPWNVSTSAADIREMKDRRDYRGLIRALRNRDLDIQWQASTALAELGTEGMDHHRGPGRNP
jgi:HEAT repeat protein